MSLLFLYNFKIYNRLQHVKLSVNLTRIYFESGFLKFGNIFPFRWFRLSEGNDYSVIEKLNRYINIKKMILSKKDNCFVIFLHLFTFL